MKYVRNRSRGPFKIISVCFIVDLGDSKNYHPAMFASQKHIFSVLDKIDEAIEWFSLVIGNILDATINKNNTDTEETAARTSFKTLY